MVLASGHSSHTCMYIWVKGTDEHEMIVIIHKWLSNKMMANEGESYDGWLFQS